MLTLKFIPPANGEPVLGYPGIPATCPRIAGTVVIRSSDAHPFPVSTVSIALYRTDTIYIPSQPPQITSSKKEQSFLVGEVVSIFQASAGKLTENVYALDIPICMLLPIGKPMPPSLSIHRRLSTVYQLFITLTTSPSASFSTLSYNLLSSNSSPSSASPSHTSPVANSSNQQQQSSLPTPLPSSSTVLASPSSSSSSLNIIRTSHYIPIRTFDTMSTFGVYNQKKMLTAQSNDHLAFLDVMMPCTCFGPKDPVTAYIKISPNLDWPQKSKKCKIKQISLTVIETITYNVQDDPTIRKHEILKEVQFVDEKLTSQGYSCEICTEFPVIDKLEKVTNALPKDKPGFPLVFTSGITTAAYLYSIKYTAIIKAKMSKCSDINIEVPIVISQFDHAACLEKMGPISSCVEKLSLLEDLHPPVSSPKIYTAKKETTASLTELGLAIGKNGKKRFVLA